MGFVGKLPVVQEIAGHVVYQRHLRPLTDGEHAEYLTTAAATMQPSRHVLLVDTAHAAQGTSQQRKAQSDWQKQHRAFFEEHTVSAVFISSSLVVRGALTAIGWLHAFPYRYSVVADFESGVVEVLQALERAALPVPEAPDLERLRRAALITLDSGASAR